MIQINLTTSSFKETFNTEASRTVREVLNERDVDYSRFSPTINGGVLSENELNKTFEQLGYFSGSKIDLAVIAKLQNAR